MNPIWPILLVVVLLVLIAGGLLKTKGGGQYTDLIQHQGKYLNLLNKTMGMFIVDFDMTLTVRPAFIGNPRFPDYDQRLIQQLGNAKKIFGGDDRIKMLNKYFKKLKERGIEIIVLTDNFKETVAPLLANIGLKQYITIIIDYNTYFDEPKGVKVRNIIKPDVKCVFADDDYMKHRSVDIACEGKCICMYPPKFRIIYPLTEEGFKKIVQTFEPDPTPIRTNPSISITKQERIINVYIDEFEDICDPIFLLAIEKMLPKDIGKAYSLFHKKSRIQCPTTCRQYVEASRNKKIYDYGDLNDLKMFYGITDRHRLVMIPDSDVQLCTDESYSNFMEKLKQGNSQYDQMCIDMVLKENNAGEKSFESLTKITSASPQKIRAVVIIYRNREKEEIFRIQIDIKEKHVVWKNVKTSEMITVRKEHIGEKIDSTPFIMRFLKSGEASGKPYPKPIANASIDIYIIVLALAFQQEGMPVCCISGDWCFRAVCLLLGIPVMDNLGRININNIIEKNFNPELPVLEYRRPHIPIQDQIDIQRDRIDSTWKGYGDNFLKQSEHRRMEASDLMRQIRERHTYLARISEQR